MIGQPSTDVSLTDTSLPATILIYAALVAVMNLIVDIMYGIIDPRISYE